MKDCKLKRALLKVYDGLWDLSAAISRKYTDLYIKLKPIAKDKIVFDSFGGQGYGDNPKYIAEEIHRQALNWDMVWLTNDINIELPSYLRAVRYDSDAARRELGTAKFFVKNRRNGMKTPKKKGQIFLQTWHGGLGFKRVEAAAEEKLSERYLAAAKKDGQECDAIISSCALQTEDYRQNFWLNPETEILEFGQPRCDALWGREHQEIAQKVRQELNIANDKAIILYTPTFRDEVTTDCYSLDYHGILNAFEKKYGKEFVLVVRLHPNVLRLCDFLQYNEKIINGSKYPDIQELFVASDFLISDYSSAVFDFSLLNKPVFLCMLDFEEYKEIRGFTEVFDICPFPKAFSNAQMLTVIEQFHYDEYMRAFYQFKTEIWQPFDEGAAAQKTVDWLRQQI